MLKKKIYHQKKKTQNPKSLQELKNSVPCFKKEKKIIKSESSNQVHNKSKPPNKIHDKKLLKKKKNSREIVRIPVR